MTMCMPKGYCSICGVKTLDKYSTMCRSCCKKGKPAWNKGLKGFMKGRKVSLSTRIKQSEAQLGEKNHMWKGGTTRESQKRNFRYWEFKDAVIQRDGSVCTICGRFCMYPIVHHVLHSADYPELKHDVSNGKTLCHDCHMTIHNKVSYYRKRGEFSGNPTGTTLSQSWEETSKQVQRILDETKEIFSMSVTSNTSAPLEREHIC
jgi:hypothetical protein